MQMRPFFFACGTAHVRCDVAGVARDRRIAARHRALCPATVSAGCDHPAPNRYNFRNAHSGRVRVSRFLAVLIAALAVAITGCATLPPPESRVPTYATVDADGTRLRGALAADVAAHPGLTGIHPLPDPRDAFAARALLAGI